MIRQLPLLGLSGCQVAEVPVDPGIELGTGELEFEALDDGDELSLIRGPQGGYHFLGSVRTKGIEAGDPDDLTHPDNPTVTFQANILDMDLVPNAQYEQGLDENQVDPWTHEMIGRLAILDIGHNVDADNQMAGLDVRFSVTVVDASGDEYTDLVDAIITLHPFN